MIGTVISGRRWFLTAMYSSSRPSLDHLGYPPDSVEICHLPSPSTART
jgi:hypothetical protein